jgi:hypothetical protein
MSDRRPRRLVIDPRPGRYYVTCINAGRVGFVAGPFRRHQAARRFLWFAKRAADRVDPWSHFYAWGTSRLRDNWDKPIPVGALNAALGISKVAP